MNHRGELLVDANGQQLKAGATVVDDMFGEGIVRGTVQQNRGEGINIRIDSAWAWRVAPAISQKPAL